MISIYGNKDTEKKYPLPENLAKQFKGDFALPKGKNFKVGQSLVSGMPPLSKTHYILRFVRLADVGEHTSQRVEINDTVEIRAVSIDTYDHMMNLYSTKQGTKHGYEVKGKTMKILHDPTYVEPKKTTAKRSETKQ